jgi:hypothetical protein
LPLYRQSGIPAREGVEIDRTTMAEWMGHVAWWVRPLAVLIGGYERPNGWQSRRSVEGEDRSGRAAETGFDWSRVDFPGV